MIDVGDGVTLYCHLFNNHDPCHRQANLVDFQFTTGQCSDFVVAESNNPIASQAKLVKSSQSQPIVENRLNTVLVCCFTIYANDWFGAAETN